MHMLIERFDVYFGSEAASVNLVSYNYNPNNGNNGINNGNKQTDINNSNKIFKVLKLEQIHVKIRLG